LILGLREGLLFEAFRVRICRQEHFDALDLNAMVLKVLNDLRQGLLNILAGLRSLDFQYPCDALVALMKSNGHSTQFRRVQADDNLTTVLLNALGYGILDLTGH
jgi:hypothetical protein